MNEKVLELPYIISTQILFNLTEADVIKKYGEDNLNLLKILTSKHFCKKCANESVKDLKEIFPEYPIVSVRDVNSTILNARHSSVLHGDIGVCVIRNHLNTCAGCGVKLQFRPKLELRFGHIENESEWAFCKKYIDNIIILMDRYKRNSEKCYDRLRGDYPISQVED